MAYGERQKQVRLYRGQIPSPGRPTVAWREDRVRFWDAIARGVKTEDAATEAGVSSPVAFRWFRHAGGMNPRLPPTVSGRYLSFSEREDIAIWHAQSLGVREIARRLGRHPSTISRELRRNASTRTYHLDYKASIAQWHAERRARRPKVAKLAANGQLRDYVQDRLSGVVSAPMVGSSALEDRSGRAGTNPIAEIASGWRGGAPNRSRTGSRSITPMMGR
jgi:AraC-like DNA-binding protein